MKITKQILEDILEDLKNQRIKKPVDKELYIMNKYSELYNNYPFLLKKLTKIENDKDNLNMLFLLVEKMESINSGQENQTEVEAELGQKLADKYLN